MRALNMIRILRNDIIIRRNKILDKCLWPHFMYKKKVKVLEDLLDILDIIETHIRNDYD